MKSNRHILFRSVFAATWLASAAAELGAADADFRRGDANADGKLDLTDAVFVLLHLFTGGQSPPCLDAADANDDGALNLTDSVLVLSHLFQGTGPLAEPFEACGWDPTVETLGCASYLACSPATEVREAWVALLESPKPLVVVERIAVDLAGGVYVQTSDVTVKYDTEGNEKWKSPYPGGEGRAADLAVDDAGNVHVTGHYYDQPTGYKFTTVKYAADGKELWVVRDGPSGIPNDLAVDSAGNAYVTGTRFVTVKYDAGGKQLWRAQYRFSDTSLEESQNLAVDSDGNVYVTGASQADDTIADSDFATVKYDAKGNQLWAARYDGPADRDRDGARGLAVDGAGNVYVTGYSNPLPPAASAAVTVKYGADGSELWVARRDGMEPKDMAVDCAGNLYLTGQAQSSESKLWAYTTVKYDTDGRELWVASYHRPESTHSNSLVLDNAGSVYVTGLSLGRDEGSTEVVTVKYDPEGDQLWVATRPAPKCPLIFQDAANLAIDRAGNVYVWGGMCNGVNPVNTLQTVKYVQSAAAADEP